MHACCGTCWISADVRVSLSDVPLLSELLLQQLLLLLAGAAGVSQCRQICADFFSFLPQQCQELAHEHGPSNVEVGFQLLTSNLPWINEPMVRWYRVVKWLCATGTLILPEGMYELSSMEPHTSTLHAATVFARGLLRVHSFDVGVSGSSLKRTNSFSADRRAAA